MCEDTEEPNCSPGNVQNIWFTCVKNKWTWCQRGFTEILVAKLELGVGKEGEIIGQFEEKIVKYVFRFRQKNYLVGLRKRWYWIHQRWLLSHAAQTAVSRAKDQFSLTPPLLYLPCVGFYGPNTSRLMSTWNDIQKLQRINLRWYSHGCKRTACWSTDIYNIGFNLNYM